MGCLFSKHKKAKKSDSSSSASVKIKQYSWDKKPKLDASNYTFTSTSSNKTTTRGYKSISGNAVSISNVSNGTIMISDHIGGAIVDDCAECNFFLGASSESVFIRDCRDMTIYRVYDKSFLSMLPPSA